MREAHKKLSPAMTMSSASVGEHSKAFTQEKQHHTGSQIAMISSSLEREVLAPPVWVGRGYGADSWKGVAFKQRATAAAKRVFDIVSVLLLTVGLSPFVVPLMLIMACTAGPIIYAHPRIGRGGEVFRCFKFRTMIPDADNTLYELLETNPELKAEWVRDHKLRDDPRVTRIGNLLRRTSLDELPQLWNVLRGDMSMVGPRPIVKEELLRYGRSAPVYLSVKPGVTGLWQVSGRNNMDYRRRVAIDVYYVRNQSVLFDSYILLKTIRVVLHRDGAY
jgi:Undecaprenyl-phosphate galactose phosphotransferase WbaP